MTPKHIPINLDRLEAIKLSLKEDFRDRSYGEVKDDFEYLLDLNVALISELRQTKERLASAEEALSFYADLGNLQGRNFFNQKFNSEEQYLLTKHVNYRARAYFEKYKDDK